jgi:hypothetical protein
MPSHLPLSVPGEAALWRLGMRLKHHQILSGTDPSGDQTDGRHVPRREQSAHANAVVDLVAVAEAYSVERLLLEHPQVPDVSLSNWHKRRAAWQDHARLDLGAFSGWTCLMGFVDVRNAMQHGLGRLTQYQLTKYRKQTLLQISACAVDLNGDVLTVGAEDVERCYETCRDFVVYAEHSLAPLSRVGAGPRRPDDSGRLD